MSSIQSKLEQLFKEYIELKNYIQEDSKDLEELKKKVSEEALELYGLKEKALLFFEKLGVKEIIKIDFLEMQKKLYYFVQAFKDIVEIPSEILEEVKDYKVKTVFAIVGGKKEIIDKELLDSYKQQHIAYTIEMEKYLELQKNQGT